MRVFFFSLFIFFSIPSFVSIAFSNELTISAASSLSDVFIELANNFTQKTGKKVYTNFSSSYTLFRQIEAGAPVDIFASADQKTMQMAKELSLIEKGTIFNFAKNTIVLIIPAFSKNIPNLIEDLLKPEYKLIAIAEPNTVPIGLYTKEALEFINLWNILKQKMIITANTRATLTYVVRGEVDAGFVYKTDAATQKENIREICTLEGHSPVSYPIAIVKKSKQKELAKKFIEYVLSYEGEEILKKHGFIL